jgi:hypothetical protein
MTAVNARALSMALVGGIATVLFYSGGFLLWAGLVGWAAFLTAGGDGAAFKKSVISTTFGAALAWLTLLIMIYVTIPEGSWLWMPRTGIAMAVSLLILGMAGRSKALSDIPLALYGYAALIGGSTIVVEEVTRAQKFLALHQYNPLILVVLSMFGGAVCGLVSNKLADSLARKA